MLIKMMTEYDMGFEFGVTYYLTLHQRVFVILRRNDRMQTMTTGRLWKDLPVVFKNVGDTFTTTYDETRDVYN